MTKLESLLQGQANSAADYLAIRNAMATHLINDAPGEQVDDKWIIGTDRVLDILLVKTSQAIASLTWYKRAIDAEVATMYKVAA